MYELKKDPRTNEVACIFRLEDNASISFTMENPDCVRFLRDWKSGPLGTVKNADGTDASYSDEAVIALGLIPIKDDVNEN